MWEGLFGLLVGLAAIAFFGHGLWVITARVVRFLSGNTPPPEPRRRCRRCRYNLQPDERICPYCGVAPEGPRAAEANDLNTAARLVRSLFERGSLDQETALKVERALLVRRQEILQESAEPRRPVVPAMPPRPVPPRPVPPPAPVPVLSIVRPPEEPLLDALPVEEPAAPRPAPAVRPTPFPPRLAEPPPPPQPPKPRRSVANLLAAFMEEKNILWGELVGGMLIVGCSIALVISLWKSLEAVPYFPFLLFSAITAALYGAGKYTLHHWKLDTTSRGLLVIASLLTPLNLLVLGDPSAVGQSGVEAGGLIDFAAKVVALLGFTALAYTAGKDLIVTRAGRAGWIVAIGVLGPVVGPLLASAGLDLGNPAFVLVFGCVAIVARLLALGLALRAGCVSPRSVFTVIGLSSFAALVAPGFVVFRCPDTTLALHFLGMLLPLYGSMSLLFLRPLFGPEGGSAAAEGPDPIGGGWRTVATAVRVTSVAVMLLGVALAWPSPTYVLVTSLVTGLALAFLAFRGRQRGLHALAFPCLALAAVLGFHRLTADLPTDDIFRLLSAPENGAVLVGLAAVLAVVGEVLVRRDRGPEGKTYALGAAVAAVLGLLVVSDEGNRHPALAAAVYAACAAGSLAGNTRWRRASLEYAGCGLAVAASLRVLQWVRPDAWPLWELVLAVEAALLALGHVRARTRRPGTAWRDAAVATAVLSIFLMATNPIVPAWYAATSAALAVTALALALAGRSSGWFGVCQLGVIAAALFAVDAWLEAQGRVKLPYDPRDYQAYGVGLGLFALLMVVARLALRSSRTAVAIGVTGFTLDRLLVAGLIVGQLLLAVAGVAPGVVAEMTPDQVPNVPPQLAWHYGPGAQLLLALLTVVLTLNLWERGRTSIAVGLTVAALTVPVLWAGPFSPELAAASALRWGLASCFVVVAAVLWVRQPLGRLASAVGINFRPDSPAPLAVRVVLNLFGGVAVLALTTWLAAVGFAGRVPAGPLPQSFFAQVGPIASALVPLALLVLGLSGHALRERMPGYAFAAGLVADVALAGGYALSIVTGGGALGESELVQVAQLATLGFGVWALAWMVGRHWLYTRSSARAFLVLPALAKPMLALQIALAVGGNLILLGGAVAVRGNVLVDPTAWALEAGSPLGAVALAAGLVAFAAWHRHWRESAPWQAPFFIGLTLPVLLACAAERALNGSGYRVLLLAWPGDLLLWALSALRPGWRQRLLPGVVFDDRELPVGVALASVFTAIVASKTVWLLDGYPPAAVASVLTALAFAVLAVARRSEGLAFLAALGGNVAVSLLVANHYHGRDLALWAFPLVRANVVASAVAALAWLWLRRRLAITIAPGPLLALQAVLGLVGNTLLLCVPVGALLLDPGTPLAAVFQPALPVSGWLTLALAALAAFWMVQQVAPSKRVDVLGIAGLSAGVLLACAAAPWDTGDWLSYHVLSAAWAAAGVAAVVAGSVLYALRVSGVSAEGGEPRARWFASLLPSGGLRRWVEIAGVGLAVLALRSGWEDPYRPYFPAGAMLLVSVLAAALALWFRRARHVWASGLLFNLAGIILWLSGDADTLESFLLVNVIGLAAAAAFWFVVRLALPAEGEPVRIGHTARFAHFATGTALALLLCVAGGGLADDFGGEAAAALSPLAWPAVAVLAGALAVALWDVSARWVVVALYSLGLAATGMALHQANLTPDLLTRAATLALAAYTLLVALVQRSLTPALLASVGLPRRDGRWFAPVQLLAAGVVTVAGGWISLNCPALSERLVGPAAVAITAVAAAVLASPGWRQTLVLLTAVLVEVALAVPDPAAAAPWLHRAALLLAALTVASLACTEGLPLLFLETPDREEGRRFGAVLGVCTLPTLLALFALEFQHFDAVTRHMPFGPGFVALVPLCMVGLMAVAVRCAVVPGRDLLGLSGRGLGVYVYAVEGLLVLLLLHLGLNVPELFTGWAARFWPFIVLVVAFAGVGLSEFFERRSLTVFTGPLRHTGLFLPLLPLIEFWVRPAQGVIDAAAGQMPGAVPLLTHLQNRAAEYDRYAAIWALVGLLYAWQAVTRKSFRWGLVAALACNMGVWALLVHGGIPFVTHPQLWLIPLGLIVLVAEHVNREHLAAETAAGLRYLGISIIYVSSTADLFIAGLGNSVVLPVALAALAVAGVLAGISLRVRAFLLLGVGFLLLDVLTMIWHAAVDRYHTWVWWVSGIVLGVAILALFAVFEKRRNDVLRLIDEIKRWN